MNQNIVFSSRMNSKWDYKNDENLFIISTPKYTFTICVNYWKSEAEAICFLESCKNKQMTTKFQIMHFKKWIGEKCTNHNNNQCYFLRNKNYSLFLVTPYHFFTSEIEKFIDGITIIDPTIEAKDTVNVIKTRKNGFMLSFQLSNEYNFILENDSIHIGLDKEQKTVVHIVPMAELSSYQKYIESAIYHFKKDFQEQYVLAENSQIGNWNLFVYSSIDKIKNEVWFAVDNNFLIFIYLPESFVLYKDSIKEMINSLTYMPTENTKNID